MLPQTTIENKPHCKICLGKGFHIEINSLGKTFTSCCENNKTYSYNKFNINVKGY